MGFSRDIKSLHEGELSSRNYKILRKNKCIEYEKEYENRKSTDSKQSRRATLPDEHAAALRLRAMQLKIRVEELKHKLK